MSYYVWLTETQKLCTILRLHSPATLLAWRVVLSDAEVQEKDIHLHTEHPPGSGVGLLASQLSADCLSEAHARVSVCLWCRAFVRLESASSVLLS